MAITFVGAGTGAGDDAFVVPGMPAGATTDDLLILVIESEGEDANAEAGPSGWTLIDSVASAIDGATDRTRCTVYYAWYDAGIDRTVPDAGNHTTARIYAFRGVDTTSPFDDTAVTVSQSTNAASHTAGFGGALVSVTDNAMAVLAVAHGGNFLTFSNIANASLTGVAAGGDFQTDAVSDGAVNLFYGTKETAGAVGDWTWDIGLDEEMAAVGILLKAAVSTEARLARSAAQVLAAGDADARLARVAAQVLAAAPSDARLARTAVQVLVRVPAPGIPTITVTLDTGRVIDVSWTAPDYAVSYRLERSLDDVTWETVGTLTATTYTDTSDNIPWDTTVYYRVTAINPFGEESDPSASDSATTGTTSDDFLAADWDDADWLTPDPGLPSRLQRLIATYMTRSGVGIG